MAHLYRTTLSPTKLQLLAAWLPSQPWFGGDPETLHQVGSFRFDDPDGEVGIETILLTAGGDTVYQVPLTYRDAHPEVSPESVVGSLQHGVLGKRWVSDATLDPAYIRALIETVLSGRSEAQQLIEEEGELTLIDNDTRVRGSGVDLDDLDTYAAHGRLAGMTTRVETGIGTIEVVRRPGSGTAAPERAGILIGTWPTQHDPTLLAAVQLNADAIRQAMS